MTFTPQLKFKLLIIPFLALFFCLFSVNSAKAVLNDDDIVFEISFSTSTYYAIAIYATSTPNYDVITQEFTATSTYYLEGIKWYSRLTGPPDDDLEVYICKGTASTPPVPCSGDDLLVSATFFEASYPTVWEWVEWEFSSPVPINANDDYYIVWEAPLITTGFYWFQIPSSGDPYPDGDLYFYNSWNSVDTRIRLYGYELGDYDPDDVTIIDLDDVDDINVQVGSEVLQYQREIYCFYDVATSTNPCRIRYNYPYEMIDYIALLLYTTATTVTDYLELDILIDQTNLRGYFDTTYRSYETSDEYHIFTYDPSIASGTENLSDTITVYWVSSTTDDMLDVPKVFDFFKRTFPLSIVIQLRNFLNEYRDKPETYEELIVPFNMFIATSTGYTVSGNLFEASWPQDNLTWYDDVIIYLINALWVLFALIIVIKQIRMVFGTNYE